MEALAEAFEKKVDENLLIRRFNITADSVLFKSDVDEFFASKAPPPKQMSIFSNLELEEQIKQQQDLELEKELELQKVMINVKKKFGKNAILRGMNLKEGATMRDRNAQIGGHKA